ncbi:MAG TPA: DUF5686 family protein [Anaerolineales bacterium]|nr:DUF5686 family protein [Anaerolineales bacterium]
MSRTCLVVAILTCLFSTSTVFPQKMIHGTIQNADTNEPLPYANIQVKGTYYGTISNADGQYSLNIREVPATVLVRYIGFHSKEIVITGDSPEQQDVVLQPTVLEMPAVIVRAEDPGVTIMREVIRRKQIWRKQLRTYQAQAYTRLRLENDTSIVFISESTSELFWDVDQGQREVIKSKRETANIRSQHILANASYLPNFYDDDVEIQGTRVIGPTHPNALQHYTFKLVGQRSRDNKIVFDISVAPKSKLQPTFVGQLSVLDEEYAMIECDLKPSDAVIMPFPIKEWNVFHEQQFSDFAQAVWLPLDVRIGGDILISLPGIHFPRITYNQVSRISDYDVNTVLPDSLYKDKKIVTIDSISIRSDSLLISRADMIPLTAQENSAYKTIDSTMTLEKAFQPKGFIAWLVRLRVGTDNDEAKAAQEEPQQKSPKAEGSDGQNEPKKKRVNLFRGFKPQFVYNRVDEYHLGVKYRRSLAKGLALNLSGAYKTGSKRWAYGGGLTCLWGKGRATTALSLQYQSNTETCYHSDNYPIFYNTAVNLFGLEDYFDYYWNERVTVKISKAVPQIRSHLTLGFADEIHSSLGKNTDGDILGRKLIQRSNPPIEEGRLRSVSLQVELGEEWAPWGIVGQRGAKLTIEHSSPELLSSDFSFTSVNAAIYWRQVTYLKRRLLPNVLDLRLVAGTSSGQLPLQRYGILDVHSGAFSPFGVFRTLGVYPYEGEKHAALFWEHNFRTVPFELLGIRYLVKNSVGLILHGASGRTWIAESRLKNLPFRLHHLGSFHYEIGLSVNGLFGFSRIDFTKAIDNRGWFVGFGIARIF